ALLCGAAAACGGDDDVVAGPPVRGSGDVLGVGRLQGLDDPGYLVEVAPGAEGVVEYEPDLGLRVYDENGADCLGVALAGLDHAVFVGDLHADVLDERELDLNILHALPAELLDLAQPGDVRVER